MAFEDEARNTAETARGKAKEVAGQVTNDQGIEAEGDFEQILGHLKQAGQKLKDAFKSGTSPKSGSAG